MHKFFLLQQVSRPEQYQPIYICLFCTDLDLVVAGLVFASIIDQILISDLFPICSPSMRKDSVFRDIPAVTLNRAELGFVVKNALP
jgi:hypothetical protein